MICRYRCRWSTWRLLTGTAAPVDAVAYTRDHACNLLRRLLSAGSPADFTEKLDALQLPGRKLLPLYPLVKPLFRLLRTVT